MTQQSFIQQAFFFAVFLFVGYVVWLLMTPFITALTIASILVLVSYPLYTRLRPLLWRQNESLAAFCSTLIVLLTLLLPLALLSAILVQQFVATYQSLEAGGGVSIGFITTIEETLQAYIPSVQLNVTDQITQSMGWLSSNLGSIFAGTANALLGVILTVFATFYLFRDGERFLRWLIKISPLPDDEDELILTRLARAVRSVVVGTIFIAFIQGVMASIGFAIFGIEQPVLWGMVAAVAALIPAVGTSVVLLPMIAFLFFTGTPLMALGLLLWGMLMVGSIDNLLAPYVLSRGNNIHPFAVLIAVLGGLSLFGPIGFVLGPVFVSLFLVLVELYSAYFANPSSRESV